MKKYALLILVFACFISTAQETDFKRLTLMLNLDTNMREVLGTVSLTFNCKWNEKSANDSIYLNGINMDYKMVSLNAKQVDFSFDEKGIWFITEAGHLKPKDNTIVIHYSCRPRRGIFFVGWDNETGLSKRQIWTQGQGIDHRHWIPYKDDQTDKLVTEMIVSFDSSYQVVSNGELVMKSKNDYKKNEHIWHYRMKDPHPGYLMMLGIGKYDKKETKSRTGIALSQYYYPERAEDYPWYYYKNEEIFNFLEKEIGVAYPWQNYKQVPVQDFQHGAMENTSATIFGDFFLVDKYAFKDRNYTYVNAHELAHQWFGNYVTAESSDDHWLHEGFATYYQWLSEKNLYGSDFFDWERYKAAEMVFDASRIDTVPLGNGKAGSSRFYQKGAWVLYMMNRELGHETFRKVIKHYLVQNKFGVVTTQDFIKAIKEVTGKDFSAYFRNWVSTAGEPSFNLKSWQEGDSLLLQYLPGEMPFADSTYTVDVDLYMEDGSKQNRSLVLGSSAISKTIWVNKDSTSLLDYWVFNPNMKSLAIVKEEKPVAIWVKQLESNGLLDKYEALRGLSAYSLDKKENALKTIFLNEKEHYALRAEALRQLISGGFERSDMYISMAITDDNSDLQKETLEMLEHPTDAQRKMIAKLRFDKPYNLRVSAIHKSIDPNDPLNNEWLKNSGLYSEPGLPSHQVAITASVYRYLIFKEDTALLVLKNYSSTGFDFMTRIEAMNGLLALQYFDKEMLPNYFEAMFNYNRKLARAARAVLSSYYENEDYKKWIDHYVKSKKRDWSDFEIRMLNRTFGLNLD